MAGVTMRAMKVEESSPPMITHASGEYIAEFCSASGSNPPTAVALVSGSSRKRTSPARSIASSSGTPSPRNRFREVHQQDRVLRLDADERDEADDGSE